MAGVLQLVNVTKVYSETKPAVQDLSLDIVEGSLTFLIGPSGSGKTTLLKLFSRELLADSGQVFVAGLDVGMLWPRQLPKLRRLVAVIHQNYPLLHQRNVADNLRFALFSAGWPKHQINHRVEEQLAFVGLASYHHRYPHELSGGEKQRVAIARAIAVAPAVLLADEPTGNLDPDASRSVTQLLAQIAAKGTTVVMATHNTDLLDQTPGRVVELSQGTIVRDDIRGRYQLNNPQLLS